MGRGGGDQGNVIKVASSGFLLYQVAIVFKLCAGKMGEEGEKI